MQKKSETNVPPFPLEFIKRMKAMLGNGFEDFIMFLQPAACTGIEGQYAAYKYSSVSALLSF